MFGFRKSVYLDSNATTSISHDVLRAMKRAMKYNWGNPSAQYFKGKQSAQLIEKARQQVASAITANAHEIYFTSCATESNNAVLKSLFYQFFPQKTKIISTPIEHPSIINTLEFLTTQGLHVEYCDVDKHGFVDLDNLESLIDNNTFLICCMLANNEIGTIQNIKAVTAIAKQNNILMFSDCVQALGKIPVNVKELGIDYASFSAHKLYGPKGVGALYAKITAPMIQFMHGGHQEEGTRAGTEGIHNIVGFGHACKNVEQLINLNHKNAELSNKFIRDIKSICKTAVINSPAKDCIPNTISITFPGIKSSEMMLMLDYHNIYVSSGSACSSKEDKPSHVLKAIGLSDQLAEETIRISLGKDTSDDDMKFVLKILSKYLNESKQS